jgi:hypothetical protein
MDVAFVPGIKAFVFDGVRKILEPELTFQLFSQLAFIVSRWHFEGNVFVAHWKLLRFNGSKIQY